MGWPHNRLAQRVVLAGSALSWEEVSGGLSGLSVGRSTQVAQCIIP